MNHTKSRFSCILVRPIIPENVGFVARSINAFGTDDLRLVSPRFDLDTQSPAYKTASGSQDILQNTKQFDCLDDALADCHHTVGFSRRIHDFERPQMTLSQWISRHQKDAQSGKTALIFGPEDQGLSNEDKHSCEILVSIPSVHSTLSLNLSHAVSIVLYELSKMECVDEIKIPTKSSLITHADKQRIVSSLVSLMDETNYFKTGRRDYQIEQIRHGIMNFGLTMEQYHSVMGGISAIKKRLKNIT